MYWMLILTVFAAMAWFIKPWVLILTTGFLMLLTLPVGIATCVCLWIGWRRGRLYPFVVPTIRGLLFLGGFLLLLIPVNRFIYHQAVDAAKAFPPILIPHLENYKNLHGGYPSHLSALRGLPSLPRLLDEDSYHLYKDTYSFSFTDPMGSPLDSWDYDSGTGAWTRTD